MRVKRIVTAFALALGLCAFPGSTAFAGQVDGGAASETKAKSKKNDPSRRVCRNLLPTGSRLSTRSCRTQAEWDKAEIEAQESALRQQIGPGGRPEPTNTGVTTTPR